MTFRVIVSSWYRKSHSNYVQRIRGSVLINGRN